jgi:hypothetical protein
MRRRPKRSPIAPAGSSSPAKTSAYASTTHCSCVGVAPVSRARSRQRDVERGDGAHDGREREAHHHEDLAALRRHCGAPSIDFNGR